jgi:hypothetical protein
MKTIFLPRFPKETSLLDGSFSFLKKIKKSSISNLNRIFHKWADEKGIKTIQKYVSQYFDTFSSLEFQKILHC